MFTGRDRIALATHDTAIWCCQTHDYDDAALNTLAQTLSPQECARAARFVRPDDRRDFIAAHALLRHALSRHDGATSPDSWHFINGPTGKPELSGAHEPSLTFNLSHTAGFAVCAVGRHRAVGIDVERIREMEDASAIAGRFFSPEEVAAIDELYGPDRLERFFEVWTLKEAYVKGLGRGLTVPLDAFAFGFRDGRLQFDTRVDTATWRFWLFEPARNVRVALSVQAADAKEPLQIVFGDTHEPFRLLSQTGVPDCW